MSYINNDWENILTYTVPLSARNEIKFVGNIIYLQDVLLWIKMNKYSFNNIYDKRKVNSIYFDSFDGVCYEDNITGHSSRTKLRVRWYDDNRSLHFELKRKRNSFGWKLIEKFSPEFNIKDVLIIDLSELIRKELPMKYQYYIDIYSEPTVLVSYDREYFLSSNDKIRITVDTNQKFTDLTNGSVDMHEEFDTFVVEFKFHSDDYGAVSNMIENFPLRLSKNSKYINAKSCFIY